MPLGVTLPSLTISGSAWKIDSGNSSPRGILIRNSRSRRKTMSRRSIDSAPRSPCRVADGMTSPSSTPRAFASTLATLVWISRNGAMASLSHLVVLRIEECTPPGLRGAGSSGVGKARGGGVRPGAVVRLDLAPHRAEQVGEVAGDEGDPDGPPDECHPEPVAGGGGIRCGEALGKIERRPEPERVVPREGRGHEPEEERGRGEEGRGPPARAREPEGPPGPREREGDERERPRPRAEAGEEVRPDPGGSRGGGPPQDERDLPCHAG